MNKFYINLQVLPNAYLVKLDHFSHKSRHVLSWVISQNDNFFQIGNLDTCFYVLVFKTQQDYSIVLKLLNKIKLRAE